MGRNLIRDGKLRQLLGEMGEFSLSDYDQNVDVLTGPDGVERKTGFGFPGNNTRPQDLLIIFSHNTADQYRAIRDFALGFDVVVIKSCYPNSNITSDEELEQVKRYYQSICEYFVEQNKRLVILTSPPLVSLMTKRVNADMARRLAGWLTTTNFGDAVSVFDFFDWLATPTNQRRANTLRKDYRRWLPIDSHPNRRASEEIAPRLVAFLQEKLM